MSYGVDGTGITEIDEGASLEIIQTSTNGNYSTWYNYGTITINEGANLKIINEFAGITTGNYNIYFSGSSSGLILNKPNQIILYNKGTNVLYASTNVSFSFSFSRINLFNTLVEMDNQISLTNIPTFAWYKPSEVAMISCTFNATTTTITSHNFTPEELATLAALTNFVFPSKKIFSLWAFAFNVNALTDKDTKMIGLTKPKASILIQYNEISEVITADENGQFSYTYEEALPVGTKITFQSKLTDEVIYHTKVITIVYSGELVIDKATKKITFLLEPISMSPFYVLKRPN